MNLKCLVDEDKLMKDSQKNLAGMAGFEPANDGIKTRCLTAWRHYHKAILNGTMMEGIACDDGVAAHFVDGKLEGCVSSLPKAKAYYVSEKNGSINESIIEPKYL